jgi:uncharacterized protein YqeY
MDLRNSLELALRDAMRSKNEAVLRTIRMVLSTVKLSEVEKGKPLDEAGIITVLQKEIKSRRESISDAEKANRPDLIDAAKAEIVILEKYLPEQLTNEALEALVDEAIFETSASSPADMGKVMKALLPKVQGRVSGDVLSQMVRKMLAG